MNAFTNPNEALQFLDRFAKFDYISMNALLCMMVDTVSAVYGEDSVTIATRLRDAVQSINSELGAYHLPPDERSNTYA